MAESNYTTDTKNSPCRGCESRCEGCHGQCEKYASWKEFGHLTNRVEST